MLCFYFIIAYDSHMDNPNNQYDLGYKEICTDKHGHAKCPAAGTIIRNNNLTPPLKCTIQGRRNRGGWGGFGLPTFYKSSSSVDLSLRSESEYDQ